MERRSIEKLTEEFMGQFREVFRQRREEQSLRRCDVAERSGLSAQMITYFEEAERQPLLVLHPSSFILHPSSFILPLSHALRS